MKNCIINSIFLFLLIFFLFGCEKNPTDNINPTSEELIIGTWELQSEFSYSGGVVYDPNEVIFIFDKDTLTVKTETDKKISYPAGKYSYDIEFDCLMDLVSCSDSIKVDILRIAGGSKSVLEVDLVNLMVSLE